MLKERSAFALPGLPVLLLALLVAMGAIALTIQAGIQNDPGRLAYTLPVLVVGIFILTGLFVVNPNEAVALQLFGDYRGTVQLDEERKAAMVSNLLVVLCSERSANPVVNAGTLYH